MRLKTWIVFLTTFSLIHGASAHTYESLKKTVSPKPVKADFGEKWISPKAHTNKKLGIRSLKRFTVIGGRTFSIANFTVFTFPKAKWNTAQTMDLIEEGFEQKWKRKVGKEHSSLEGYWPGANRYMRYSFYEGSDQIVMTLYSGRVGYWDSTYPEALTLEKAFAPRWQKKTTSIPRFLLRTFIKEAQAQGIFSSIFGGSSDNGASSLVGGAQSTGAEISNLNTTLEDFNDDFDNLSLQLDSLNGSVSDGNTNWANTNTQIDGANQNWADSNDQLEDLVASLDEGIDNANTNWANSNEMADRNWGDTNKQLSRANDLAAKALDPKHMFTLAAATSAGAVLGATLAQTAIDLMVMGAGAIYEAITGAKADAERWAKFKEARQQWEKNLETATQLEKLLDNFLLSHAMMKELKESLTDEQKKSLSREDMARMLSINTRILKKRLKEKEDLFFETKNPQCEAQLAVEMEDLEQKIEDQIGLKEILKNSNFDVYNDEYFCNEVPKLFGKLAEAEAMLAQYRLDILSARSQWAEFEKDRLEDMADQMERLNKGKEDKKFTDNLIENAETTHELYVDLLEDTRDHWVKQCRELIDDLSGKKYAERLKICEEKYNHWSLNETCAKTFIIDKFSHDDSFHDKNQKKRKICRDAHDGSYLGKRFERNEFRSKDMRDKKIKGYEQNRGQNRRNYLMNLEVENQRLTSFQRFFDEIYEQQLCFENPENPECQEKAKIKFMGPFYVKDRAKVKLKEICGLDDFL